MDIIFNNKWWVEPKTKCYYNHDNKLHGHYTEWWPNGQLKIQCQYVNGLMIGKFMKWWSSGITDVQYFNDEQGRQHGELISLWQDGNVYNHCLYEHGMLVMCMEKNKIKSI